METSTSVFPFVSVSLNLSASIIYEGLEGVIMSGSITVESVPKSAGGGGGVGLDLMDHKSHLSLGCASTYAWEFSGTTSEARCEAEPSFSSLDFTVLLGAGWDPKFPEQRP